MLDKRPLRAAETVPWRDTYDKKGILDILLGDAPILHLPNDERKWFYQLAVTEGRLLASSSTPYEKGGNRAVGVHVDTLR